MMNSGQGSSSSSSSNSPCLQTEVGHGAGAKEVGKCLGERIIRHSCNGFGFTFMQLEELKQQTLIYKYIEAGLPVPAHLILPIWKSVVIYFASLSGLGCNSKLYYDYKNSMEAEPGRCKRTDGKKWRCSKDVVPDYKYCERHLHRGRSRSRKPVEPNVFNSPSDVHLWYQQH